MSDLFTVKVWAKSLPSRGHPERNEDLYWSAQNGVAHAVVDGMGGSRRTVEGREVGGEQAAWAIGEALARRLEGLPHDLPIKSARELLSVAVAEAGAYVFNEVNAAGQIPPEQIPEGKTADEVMAAAVMTVVIFCEGGRRAAVGQNGDTRCYLYSGGELIVLTDDQDAVRSDMESGVLTEEEATAIGDELDAFDGFDLGRLSPIARRYFARRFLVAGQVGDSPDPQQPLFAAIQLNPGDTLLLTSDGVHDNLTPAEIEAAMQSIDPAATLVDRADARSGERSLPDPTDLTQEYNYRAHQDDSTAVVLRVERF